MYTVDDKAIIQVTFAGYLFDQLVMNTFSYQLQSFAPINGADGIVALETAVNTATTGLYHRWRTCVSEDVVSIDQKYQWITPSRYAQFFLTPTSRVGLNGAAMAPNLAQVITRRGELATRHGISNIHIPGVPTEEVSGGLLSPAQLAVLLALAVKSVEVVPVAGDAVLVPVAFNRAVPANSVVLLEGFEQRDVRTMHRRTVGLGA